MIDVLAACYWGSHHHTRDCYHEAWTSLQSVCEKTQDPLPGGLSLWVLCLNHSSSIPCDLPAPTLWWPRPGYLHLFLLFLRYSESSQTTHWVLLYRANTPTCCFWYFWYFWHSEKSPAYCSTSVLLSFPLSRPSWCYKFKVFIICEMFNSTIAGFFSGIISVTSRKMF